MIMVITIIMMIMVITIDRNKMCTVDGNTMCMDDEYEYEGIRKVSQVLIIKSIYSYILTIIPNRSDD